MAVPLPPAIAERPRGERVAGKVAIVTGGNAGIGRATAELLAREGARVVVAARTAATGEETVRLIEAAGGEAVFIRTDVGQESDCVALVAETVRRFGRLDVLVNNAGVYPRSTLLETTIATWRQIMATNLEGQPLVRADDASTELRLLSDHRDNLVVDRTRLTNQLHAQMLQLDPCYVERSGPLTRATGVRYCQDLQLPEGDGVVQTRLLVVRQLATRIAHLDAAIKAVTAAIQQRVAATGTRLTELPGVGAVVAARLLGELGCVPQVRLAAALAGVAPLAVASGSRHGHRVNPGGNRKLNRALHIVALVQRRCEPRARAYYEKKRAEGKTGRAAMRCLKRRLIDVLFHRLQPAASPLPAPITAVAA